MRYFIILITLFLCSSCNADQPNLQKLSPEATILAFGDSLTSGAGSSSPKKNYPYLLSQYTGNRVINSGAPGETSTRGIKRLPGVLDRYQPDLLILIHGGNDFLKKVSIDITRNNLNLMVREAKSRDIDVILLGVPTPGILFLKSAEFYAELAKIHKIPADLETLPLILGENSLKHDPIHPNDKGYEILAQNIYTLLKNHGALD